MAIFAALLGASCDDGMPATGFPEGGGGGASHDAADGADRSTDTGSGVDAANGTDVADASCDAGALSAPNAWATWAMPNSARSGLPNPASYTVSDAGNEVTDDVTGLIWQRNAEARTYTWEDARRYCACLSLDGIGGWRLPSRIELASIADSTIANPSIDSIAFPGTPSESFWSSSVLSSDPMLAYLVYFANGHTSYVDLGYTYRVRCTRSPPPPMAAPPGRYTIGSGTVLDTQTKLTWQQMIPTASYTWSDAKTYCAGLSLDGTGWRLPSINELQTIVDESTNPAIDGATFPMTPSEYFWSSTAVVEDPSRAWTCFFSNGSTYSFSTTTPENVRCVR
jgi:hypothetical protein